MYSLENLLKFSLLLTRNLED